ncbi:MAG: hypothetical protein ABIJ37_00805 [Pseudomonadota bacterium]
MKKIITLFAMIILLFSNECFASSISKITLSELYSKADLIVMAQVIELIKKGNQDYVTIQVDSYLKGPGTDKTYTFILVSSGGLKDFDPSLRKGDTGVFFLKHTGEKGLADKAYWGSVATFSKNHFDLTAEEIDAERGDSLSNLETWRSYRIKRGEIKNIKEYEKGFKKGYTGPPGFVDGSHDFNLGHSDGMLSKMKRSPK